LQGLPCDLKVGITRKAFHRMRLVQRLSIRLLLIGIASCVLSSYALALDDAQVKHSFEVFQHDWMAKLNKHGKYGPASVQVSEDPAQPGTFIAKYEDLSEPTGSEVKKTGQKATPYVGVLHYDKVTRVCKGKSPEEAKQGTFKAESEEGITEIFRFSNGKWMY
jgi:hypothetical protein